MKNCVLLSIHRANTYRLSAEKDQKELEELWTTFMALSNKSKIMEDSKDLIGLDNEELSKKEIDLEFLVARLVTDEKILRSESKLMKLMEENS